VNPKIYTIESEKYFNINDDKTIENYNNEIKGILKNHNKTIIKSNLPGAGKSTAASFGGSNVLYCTPFNMLCHILSMDEKEAITVCKLLNLHVNDNDEHTKKKVHFDVTDYDCIVFDEILMHAPETLSRIYKFMLKFPDKKFIATGDTDQLPCISFNFNNVQDQNEYINNCIKLLFPTQIVLCESKRLVNQDDKEKLKQLKKDIFDQSKDIMTTIKKYNFKIIKSSNELTTTTNISYFKNKAYEINQHIQKKEKLPEFYVPVDYHNENSTKKYTLKYYKDQTIVCKTHHQSKNGRLYVNFQYIITSIDDKTVSLC